MRKRVFAWLLSFAMLVSFIPDAAFADESSGEDTEQSAREVAPDAQINAWERKDEKETSQVPLSFNSGDTLPAQNEGEETSQAPLSLNSGDTLSAQNEGEETSQAPLSLSSGDTLPAQNEGEETSQAPLSLNSGDTLPARDEEETSHSDAESTNAPPMTLETVLPVQEPDSGVQEQTATLFDTTIIASGECGAEGSAVTWALDADGLLTISGMGPMEGYVIATSPEEVIADAPWCNADVEICSVVIGDGVENIGSGAFFGLYGLESVTIPESVTDIGDMAFYGCGLTSVTIPSGVTSIAERAFNGCEKLTGIHVEEGNPAYSSVDGVLFDKNQTRLLRYPSKSGKTSYSIPDGVSSIGDYAFFECFELTNVMIPDGVTSIGSFAFANCFKLTSATIPDGVTSIAERTFSWCGALTSVMIPDSVRSIGDHAFFSCRALTSVTIPNSVISIGSEAFADCALTSVTIPNSVTSIGNAAFCSCYMLAGIDVQEGNPAYYSVDGILFEKNLTQLLFYPIKSNRTSYSIPNSVRSIEDCAFEGCDALRSVMIPNSVTSIGNYAFRDCVALESVTIPDSVTSIGDDAFCNCYALASVTIPDGVTSIGEGTFSSCSALTSVTIPDGVRSIGDGAFGNCEMLTSVTIPDSVISIGEFTFGGCIALTNVTIPDSVSSIGDGAFDSCSALESITIPDGVRSIGEYTFGNCSALTSVTIPDSVTSIGNNAFESCGALTDVYYSGTETQWGAITKGSYNEALTSATIYYNWTGFVASGECGAEGGNVTWTLDTDGLLTISGTGAMADYVEVTLSGDFISMPWSSAHVELHSVVIEDGVTYVGAGAFRECEKLANVTIPDSVSSIGDYAFSECYALTSVTLPNVVSSIGNHTFEGCVALTSVKIPNSVTSIGDYAFGYCSALTSVKIPNGVSSIKEGVFEGCEALKSVTIPNSVSSIEAYAFDSCAALRSVVIPNGVTSIGDSAFEACHALKSVTIPNSVSSIGNSAFHACETLESVTIPNSVSSIGHYMFHACEALTSVTIPVSVSSIGNSAFEACDALADVYYSGSEEQWNAVTKGTDNAPLTSAEIHYHYTPEEPTSEIIAGGECGAEGYVQWTLNADGVLTVSGEGDMENYAASEDVPWSDNASQIVKVTVQPGVTNIGWYAFSNCTALTSVEIPESVTYIGGSAFQHCTGLTSVIIPQGVTSIGPQAFWGCTELQELTLQEGVEEIGLQAFVDCRALSRLAIPSSVTRIGEYAFYGCDGLTGFDVASDNPSYSSVNGLLFNKGHTRLLRYPPKSDATSYTVPIFVIYIESGAFQNCVNLQSVRITSSRLRSIGEGAFSDCSALTSISIRSSLSKISAQMFMNCKSLASLEISTSVVSIETGAFWGCSALASVTIPGNVSSIGESAFSGCSSLASVTIPESVTSIGNSAFSSCANLADIYYRGSETQWRAIKKGSNNAQLTSATIHYNWRTLASGECGADGDNVTWTLDIDGLLTISGTGAMTNYVTYGPTADEDFVEGVPWRGFGFTVKNVVIEDGVTNLGAGAFSDTSQLKSVTIPESVTDIGYMAFSGSGLTSITIPKSVSSIAERAFNGCYRLTSVTIPDSVSSIGDYAFSDCSALTSVTIPDSVSSIAERAFNGCSSLTEINVEADNAAYSSMDGVLFDKNQTRLLRYPIKSVETSYSIPNGVSSIGNYAFSGCYRLTSVTIPDSVSSIGDYAFSDCSALTSVTIPDSVSSIGDYAFTFCSALTSVTLPNGLSSIGDYAFAYCDALTSVTLPDSVTSIGNGAFSRCDELTGIEVGEGNPAYCSVNGVLFDKNQTKLLLYPPKSGETSYSIPDSVSSIGDYAFSGCLALTGVTIPNCVSSIGAAAFEECGALTGLTIPNSVSSIGDYAFSGCLALTDVTISNRVDSIGEGTFCGCEALTNVTIPNGVSSIGDYAFDNCVALTSVTIPHSVTRIGDFAFCNCTNLTSVRISDGVSSIGDGAFADCTALTDVYYSGSEEQWNAITKENGDAFPSNPDLTIHYNCREVIANGECGAEGDNVTWTLDADGLLTISGTGAMADWNGASEQIWYPYSSQIRRAVIQTGVSSIGDFAFHACKELASVTISDSVTRVGNCAFGACVKLTNIEVHEGNQHYVVVDNVLFNKERTELVCCPSGYSETSYVIPNGVTSIASSAFWDCDALTNVTIPDSVVSIGHNAFYHCSSLESIRISNNVTRIDEQVFGFCALKKVTIPNGVTSIGQYAFTHCASLEEVTIPNNVTVISDNAFFGCDNLTIYGGAGSTAETYASENSLTFVAYQISDVSPVASTTIGGPAYAVTVTMNAELPLSVTAEKDGVSVKIPAEDGVSKSNGKVLHTLTLDLSGLQSGVYQFRFSNSAYGVERSVSYDVDRSAPSTPENFRAVPGNLKNTLAWDTAKEADITSIRVYRTTDENAEPELLTSLSGRAAVTYTDNGLTAGVTYYYWLAFTDKFSQESEKAGPVAGTPTADSDPPSVTTVYPSDGTTLTGTTVFRVSASDNQQVKSISMELSVSVGEGASWETLETVATTGQAEFTLDSTKYDADTLYVRFLAEDASGNTAYSKLTYAFPVDNTPPGIVTSITGEASATAITLQWTYAPPSDFSHFVLEKRDGNGSYAKVGGNLESLGAQIRDLAPETEYHFRVMAFDIHGNHSEYSQEYSFTTLADTAAPVITAMSPQPGRYNGSIPLLFTATDDDSIHSMTYQVSVDGLEWTDVTEITLTARNTTAAVSYVFDTTAFAEGVLYVRAVATDASGNVGDTSGDAPYMQYMVDRTAPAAPKALEGVCVSGAVYLTWLQGTEQDLNGYTVERAYEENGPYSTLAAGLKKLSYTDSGVAAGDTYYYRLRSQDTAGNTSAYSETVAVTVQAVSDTEAPQIVSVSPSEGYVLGGATPIKVKVSDNQLVEALSVQYSADGKNWNSLDEIPVSATSSVVTLPLTASDIDGDALSLRVFCTDGAGLHSETVGRSYSVDRTPPAAPAVTAQAAPMSVVLNWTSGNEGDLAGFYIYRKAGGESEYSYLAQCGKNTTSYTDSKVVVERNYSYYVSALDVRSNQSSSAPTEAVEPLNTDVEPPVIRANGDTVGTVGLEMQFSAKNTTDNFDASGLSYAWDFGDGETSSLLEPRHTYHAAGAYTVSLTVTDAAGNSSSGQIAVTVKEATEAAWLDVTVKDDSGSPISGAGVYFDLGDAEQETVYTNDSGVARVTAAEGTFTVGVYKNGYLPDKAENVTLIKGATASVTVQLVKKDIVTGKLTVEPLTLDEIEAAGIDATAPENQHVFQYEIALTYGSEPVNIQTRVNGNGQIVDDPEPLTITDNTGTRILQPFVFDSTTTDTNVTNGSRETQNLPIIAIIDLPGETKWLKDFFDVRLYVLNQAGGEYVLDDCAATLNVPDGLTLVDSSRTTASPLVEMGSITGQNSETAEWILRGDKKGEYTLSADFTATLRDFNEAIHATFRTEEPFRVRAGNNLVMDVMVESAIDAESDASLWLGLLNEDQEAYYLPSLLLSDENATLVKTFKTKDGLTIDTSSDETALQVLNPLEEIWFEYTVSREVCEELRENQTTSFYLYDKVSRNLSGVILKINFKIGTFKTKFDHLTFDYCTTQSGYRTYSDGVAFDFDWLSGNEQGYNHGLATASLALCMATFECVDYQQSRLDDNIRALYGKMGFSIDGVPEDAITVQEEAEEEREPAPGDYHASGFGKSDRYSDEVQTVAIAASKRVIEGETYLVISLRGSGYGDGGWAGDFDVGTEQAHVGFHKAAEYAKEKIQKWYPKGDPSKTHIWLTGYSRSAATANLLSELLQGEGYCLSDNIYTYTFATPNNQTMNGKGIALPKTYNITGSIDVIPKVPFEKWSMGKKGHTYNLPNGNTADSRLFSQFLTRFYELSGGKDYSMRDGQEMLLNNYFLPLITDSFSREEFEQSLQQALIQLKAYQDSSKLEEILGVILRYENDSLLLRKLLSVFYPGLEKPISTIIDETSEVFEVRKARYGANDSYIRLWKRVKYVLLKAMFELGADAVGGNFLDSLSNVPAPYRYPNAHLLAMLLELKDGVESSAFFKQHWPEAYMAWLNVLDEKDWTREYRYKINKMAIVECPVDIEVYDESGTLVGRTVLETRTLTDGETGEEYTYTVSTVDETVTTIDLIVLGDSKRLILPDDQNYRIVIQSNGNYEDGDVMRYAVFEYADGTPVSSIVYNSVGLSDTAEFEAEVTTSDNSIRTCTLLGAGGNVIDPSEVSERQMDYAVTLRANGGTVNSGYVSGYMEGTGATLPTDVTRNHYAFGGWYEAEDLTGDAVTEISATDTGDKTFYAKWILTADIAPGDIDGDGSVGMKDLSVLRRYLNGWDVAVITEAIDVNADGSVNMKDFSLLRRYLSGWPVTLNAALSGVMQDPDAGEIEVGRVSAQAGETVTVPLAFRSNPGIVAYRLYVSYDENALELLEGKKGDMPDVSFGPAENPFNILWDESLSGNATGSAVIAELTFRVKEGASGYSPISVTYSPDDIYNSDLVNVPFEVNSGGVEILAATGVEGDPDEPSSHSVTVSGGSGSGQYAAGDSVTIKADTPPDGQTFDRWIGADGVQFISGDQTSENAVFRMPDSDITLNASFRNEKPQGCYIATAVYGSYDCPEVWTLRRFRDNVLARTWYGRLFIKLYYALSPTAVRLFGDAQWFRDFWRGKLDGMVTELQSEGFESTPYMDKAWN